MKHNITLIALLLFMCLLGTASLKAQNSKHLRQANKEFDLHAYNMAIKSYRKVIRKDPDNAKAYIGLGECYRLLGRMNEAADWYKKALQLPDVDPIAIFHYAKTLMALGHYEKAKEWFVTYAEIQPVFGKHFAESCDFAISLRGMPASFRVKKEFVNTEASDFGPAFFNENVVFASARTDLKRKMDKDRDTWDGEAKNQLFISSIDDKGYLSSPSLLLSDLQNEYNLGPLSYSVDGKWVAFAKNNFVNGTRQIPEAGIDGSLFIAEVNPDGSWKDIRPFPHNGSGYASLYPHLSNDGKKLYFASNRPDGFGGFDIYVSFKVGKTWTSPENLGPLVNSQGNELCPYLDGDLLYFSSDWHHGLGGFDIFKAVTEDGIWTKVYHLGNAVNSSYDDSSLIYISRKGKGYF
ncbi:MAG TPA: tetratricopeptide repeat protein, partial [Phaeodactylibacter sp.]|nr:tetratricopeptide repeat protein [Phaeodactylibacter sp.]